MASSSLAQVRGPLHYSALYLPPLTLLADGVVRLYRNYDPDLSSGNPVQMVSSFRGLNEVLRMKRGAGLITEWRQAGGLLLVGGDSRIVRLWDAHIESSIMVSLHQLLYPMLPTESRYAGHRHQLREPSHCDEVGGRECISFPGKLRGWQGEAV